MKCFLDLSCCTQRGHAHFEDGRRILLGKDTVEFPCGVVGHRIDEKICETEKIAPSSSASLGASAQALRDLVQEKGALQDLDELLQMISDSPKTKDGMWDLASLHANMKASFADAFKKANVELFLCRAVVETEQSTPEKTVKREVVHKWITLVDRDQDAEYTPQYFYAPPPPANGQQQNPLKQAPVHKGCSVM